MNPNINEPATRLRPQKWEIIHLPYYGQKCETRSNAKNHPLGVVLAGLKFQPKKLKRLSGDDRQDGLKIAVDEIKNN